MEEEELKAIGAKNQNRNGHVIVQPFPDDFQSSNINQNPVLTQDYPL